MLTTVIIVLKMAAGEVEWKATFKIIMAEVTRVVGYIIHKIRREITVVRLTSVTLCRINERE